MISFAHLSAIVLAAGLSRRAAPHNKLLLPAPGGRGGSVVRSTTAAICGAGFREVIVVTGHERARVEEALAGLPVKFVFAADFARGMGHSLAAGADAARAEACGFAIVPGDLPELTSALVGLIAERFVADGGAHHVIPVARGARGHPVMLGVWLRPTLIALSGDTGARHLLETPGEARRCVHLEVGDNAILRDVDQPAAG